MVGRVECYLPGLHRSILGNAVAAPELLEFVCYDNNNNEVKFLPVEEPPRPRRR